LNNNLRDVKRFYFQLFYCRFHDILKTKQTHTLQRISKLQRPLTLTSTVDVMSKMQEKKSFAKRSCHNFGCGTLFIIKMNVAIYARVSTQDQSLEHQKNILIERCNREGWNYVVFEEKISGAKTSRTELDKLMQAIRNKEFNSVLVWKLDRLGRSLKHLIQLIEEFNNKGVQFICLSPEVDSTTANGRFFIQIIGAVAELERELIRERTIAKLTYLKNHGVKLGRPKGSKDKKKRRKSGYYTRYIGK